VSFRGEYFNFLTTDFSQNRTEILSRLRREHGQTYKGACLQCVFSRRRRNKLFFFFRDLPCFSVVNITIFNHGFLTELLNRLRRKTKNIFNFIAFSVLFRAVPW